MGEASPKVWKRTWSRVLSCLKTCNIGTSLVWAMGLALALLFPLPLALALASRLAFSLAALAVGEV
eukprot:9728731-Lingulodinium_polyedra.AAC.1